MQRKILCGTADSSITLNLGEQSVYSELIERFEVILLQRRHSWQKIYCIHETEVQCISKGKECKKYEFVNKISTIGSATGIILGACFFRNEYDGHDHDASLYIERFYTFNVSLSTVLVFSTSELGLTELTHFFNVSST